MATNKWMHPNYDCRICKNLFCIHAKFCKHISPSYHKPHAQSLKFCCRSSNWIHHSSVFKDTTNFEWIQLCQYWPYCYIFFILPWILFIWKPSEIFMIFEVFLGQILWRARNKRKFLTLYIKCAIQCKPDISRSCISRNRIYRGRMLDPFFWRPRTRYFSRNRGNSIFREICSPRSPLFSVRGRQFFAKPTLAYLSMRAGTHAVWWSATPGGALTPPLCRRVGSS